MKTTSLALVVTVAVLSATVMAQQTRQPEVALQAAIRTETIDGDLRAAIRQYEAIARGADRGAAAQALLRMADCYQKLGDTQARSTYQRLVRDFAEQAQAVATARVRLNESSSSNAAVVARQLWTTRLYSQVTIANDGRTAAVADPNSGDIRIHDLVTGQTTPFKVVTDPASGAYTEWPVLSPDLTQIAYAWAGPETRWNYALRVSSRQPGAQPKPLGSAVPYMSVLGWASDGKSVLVDLLGAGTAQIAWISTVDGTVRPLKTRAAGLLSLSPDGRFIAYDVPVGRGHPEREIRVMASDATSESIVVRGPGINLSPVWSRDGARLVFKSNRSGTFGIWSMPIKNGHSDGSPTLLKADVGEGELVGFTATGALLYNQRLGAQDVFAMDLDPAQGTLRGTRTRLVDTFVGSNTNPSASPDGRLLAYFSLRSQGSHNRPDLMIRSLETGAERVIPAFFQYGGKPVWLPDGQGLIVAGRNDQNYTTVYKVDLKSGEVATLIETAATGRQSAAVSADGRTVYFSQEDAQGINHVVAHDLVSARRTDLPHTGNSRTMAASPDGRSIAFVAAHNIIRPFRTDLHVADADGGNVRTVLTTSTPSELPTAVPAAVAWSADSRFIYFVRQGTGSLWRVAAAGGSPALVGELSTEVVGTIDISADGRRVIYGAGGPPRIEVWALENLLPPSAASK